METQNDIEFEDRHWQAIETSGQIESEELWESIYALRKLGTARVLSTALSWCKDPAPFRRSVGVSILAQFGMDTKAYPQESRAMILAMIANEQDPEVITSLISAVHFRELPDAAAWLISLAEHPLEDVRWRVAWALPIPNLSDLAMVRLSLETLLKLMEDSEPEVREWATFSISITQEDTPAIREALLTRLSDSDFGTRSEAAVGLADRKDPRAIELLGQHLRSDRVGELFVEAAELYADSSLRPALLGLKKWWDVNPELLDRAIAACS